MERNDNDRSKRELFLVDVLFKPVRCVNILFSRINVSEEVALQYMITVLLYKNATLRP